MESIEIRHRNISSPKLIGIATFVVAVLVLSVCLFIASRGVPALSGTIYISSTNDSKSGLLETSALNLSTHEAPSVGNDDTSLGKMYSFSHNGSYVTFVGTDRAHLDNFVANKIGEGDVFQIYKASTNKSLTPAPGAAMVITQNSDLGKMNPQITDDGTSVLYSSIQAEEVPTDHSLTSHAIHLVTAAGTTTKDTVIAQGILPLWFNDTTFFYIAPDGIRLARTGSASSVVVLTITGKDNYKIALSHDRKTLAFSNPEARKVFLFDLTPNGLIGKEQGEVDILGFWTVFSPDDKSIAIQTASVDSNGLLSHPSLAFYGVVSHMKIAKNISLDPLQNDRLFVTAWK